MDRWRDVGLDGSRHPGDNPAGLGSGQSLWRYASSQPQGNMMKKGVAFAHECLIFEVCQPQQAKKVLDENMSVSTALPCRISIYEENGKTILATLKPTNLLAIFNVPQLEKVAQEVEATIVKIMKEAVSA